MKTVQEEKEILWKFIKDSKNNIGNDIVLNAIHKLIKHCSWLEYEIDRRQQTIYILRKN